MDLIRRNRGGVGYPFSARTLTLFNGAVGVTAY